MFEGVRLGILRVTQGWSYAHLIFHAPLPLAVARRKHVALPGKQVVEGVFDAREHVFICRTSFLESSRHGIIPSGRDSEARCPVAVASTCMKPVEMMQRK